MAKRDYYEVLGVSRDADPQTIKSAYRKLALKYHPDKNQGDAEAEQKFKEAAEAYEVLSNQDKRQRYNQFGHQGVDGQAGGFSNVHDIFDAFSDIFGGSVFDSFFGGGRRGHGPSQGSHIKCDVSISFAESFTGCEKPIKVTTHVPCDTCQGSGCKPGTHPSTCNGCGGQGEVTRSSGFFAVRRACPQCGGTGQMITDPCRPCQGSGKTLDSRTIEVKIPAGIPDESRLRVAGEGESGDRGGPPGDLFCYIQVLDDPLFQRENDDVVVTLPLSYSQAVLGAKVEVPTMHGPMDLKIPAGTAPGQVLAMKGLGFPNVHGRGTGRQLVQVMIEVPQKISKRHEELLKELSEVEQKNVSSYKKSFLERLKEAFE